MSITNGYSATGIAVKSSGDDYVFHPLDIDPLLASTIRRLDSKAVLSISSEALMSTIDAITHDQKSLILNATGARLPVVACLDAITPEMCHYSRACIVLRERVVVVWSDDPKSIINVTHHVERELLELASCYVF